MKEKQYQRVTNVNPLEQHHQPVHPQRIAAVLIVFVHY